MYTGSCHCGRIAFEVEGECLETNECNCSHCSRKAICFGVPRGPLRRKSSEASLSTYQFNKHVINHHFCPHCGCAPFATGAGPSGAAMAAVNVCCLEDFDLAGIKRIPVDGRSRRPAGLSRLVFRVAFAGAFAAPASA